MSVLSLSTLAITAVFAYRGDSTGVAIGSMEFIAFTAFALLSSTKRKEA
jgi:hypothetical protein